MDKFKNFFQSPRFPVSKRPLGILLLLVMAVGIPITLGLVKERQTVRQEAATSCELACQDQCKNISNPAWCLTPCKNACAAPTPTSSQTGGSTPAPTNSLSGKENGENCSTNTECKSKQCSYATYWGNYGKYCVPTSYYGEPLVTPTKAVSGKENGERCSSNTECKSKECRTATYYGTTAKFCIPNTYYGEPVVTPTRTPTPIGTGNTQIGGSCSRDSDCANGNCGITGKCVECKTDGDCAWNEHCTYQNSTPNWTCEADIMPTRTPTRTPTPTSDGGGGGGVGGSLYEYRASSTCTYKCALYYGSRFMSCGTRTACTEQGFYNPVTPSPTQSSRVTPSPTRRLTPTPTSVRRTTPSPTRRLTPSPTSSTRVTPSPTRTTGVSPSPTGTSGRVTPTDSVPTPTTRAVCNARCDTNADCSGANDGCGTCVTNSNGSKTCQSQTNTGQLNVTVRVIMPGIGSGNGNNANPAHTTRQGNLEIINSTGDTVTDMALNFEFQGTQYVGTTELDIPAGPYYVKVRLDNTLYKRVGDIQNLTTGNNTLVAVELVPGDMDGNNKLDITDYNIFRRCIVDDDCTAAASSDFNDNGQVELIDYNILLRSFATREGD